MDVTTPSVPTSMSVGGEELGCSGSDSARVVLIGVLKYVGTARRAKIINNIPNFEVPCSSRCLVRDEDSSALNAHMHVDSAPGRHRDIWARPESLPTRSFQVG